MERYGRYAPVLDHRRKTDWAQLSFGDGWKQRVGWELRRLARQQHADRTQSLQEKVKRHCGGGKSDLVPMQLTPVLDGAFFANLGAHAATGTTLLGQYKKNRPESLLLPMVPKLAEELTPAARGLAVEPWKKMAAVVAAAIEARLVQVELTRHWNVVESARIYRAAQEDLRFRSVGAVVRSVVLFGDLFPPRARLRVHPATRQILEAVRAASLRPLAALATATPTELFALGKVWLRGVMIALEEFLPLIVSRPSGDGGAAEGGGGQLRFREEPGSGPRDSRIPPLDELRPPAFLDDPIDPKRDLAQESAANAFAARGKGQESRVAEVGAAEQALSDVMDALDKATAPHRTDDVRPDVARRLARTAAWGEGPLTAQNVSKGHALEVDLGVHGKTRVEVHEQSLEPGDPARTGAIRHAAAPLTRVLRRLLYPSVEEESMRRRHAARGRLDASRLPAARWSDAVFVRREARREETRDGRPVILIAADHSSSNGAGQIRMLTTLVCALLESTQQTRIRVLAGVYASGAVAGIGEAPLVRWIVHPEKSSATTPRDAVRCLASLEQHGVGAQKEVPSFALMLAEAQRLARGGTVYLTVVSDTSWNKSTSKAGVAAVDEIREFLRMQRESAGHRLDVTLVALPSGTAPGPEVNVGGLGNVIDHRLVIGKEELADELAVAARVGTFVAGLVRSRRRRVVH